MLKTQLPLNLTGLGFPPAAPNPCQKQGQALSTPKAPGHVGSKSWQEIQEHIPTRILTQPSKHSSTYTLLVRHERRSVCAVCYRNVPSGVVTFFRHVPRLTPHLPFHQEAPKQSTQCCNQGLLPSLPACDYHALHQNHAAPPQPAEPTSTAK